MSFPLAEVDHCMNDSVRYRTESSIIEEQIITSTQKSF
ncbi:hypothetical protein Chls_151 [Chlamydia suis]|uniref:Uncharacterized protein n=1 Tax=Chlamydia suis TaxID=83559 RepID=A0ABX6ISW3_9CHLA|nr:hypothetical protein Chls_151 [Chlamydia suis]